MKNLLKAVCLILTVCFVFFAGCSNKNSDTMVAVMVNPAGGEKDADEKESPEDGTAVLVEEMLKPAEDVEESETEVTFLDNSGREKISIAKNPKKVAVLYGSLACLWYESGGKASVAVGGDSAIELYKEQIGRNILEDEGVVTISGSSSGKTMDIEKVFAEQPDLIICSTSRSGYETISGPAEAAGIPVIAVTYDGIEDYVKWAKIFTSINGKPELFEEIATKTINDVATVISKIPKDTSPRVLSIWPHSEALKANLETSEMGEMIKALKGINVASEMAENLKGDRIDVNLEQIYTANPDLILIQVISSEEFVKENMAVAVGESPVWSELDAVKNDKVIYMPKALFHNKPNHRYNEAYKLMAETLYPETDFTY